MLLPVDQKAIENKSGLPEVYNEGEDSLEFWCEAYFAHAVTTAPSSRKVQVRDLSLFIGFANKEGVTTRREWTPPLSRAFVEFLRSALRPDGRRYWSDRTNNRVLAHLKTFARWIHKLAPFPLGNPMEDIRLMLVGSNLDVERALTPAERRRLLDAADLLVSMDGKSKDRRRNKTNPVERPSRMSARPWRNRAIVYCLIETGMRRAAVVNLNLDDIDWKDGLLYVKEKGWATHSYPISDQGLTALKDYMEQERLGDARDMSPAFFLPANTIKNSTGRLTPLVINQVWDRVCAIANLKGKSPHSARHAMGRFVMDKTGKISAVQRQLGHRNVAYSVQYARVSNKEIRDALNDRK